MTVPKTVDKSRLRVKTRIIMMHTVRCLCFILPFFLIASCATVPPEVLYPAAPTLLPGVEPDMNTSGFWIGRDPDPDRVILDSAGIGEFNRRVLDAGFINDLASYRPKSGPEIKKEFDDTVAWVAGSKVFRRDGKRVDRAFLDPLVAEMNEAALPAEISPSYGFLLRRTDMRALPTGEPLYDGPGDSFIDNLQASSLETGTPLVVLLSSKSGAWYYAVSDLLSGWVPSDAVVLADREAFLARYRNAATLTVTSSRADLYADERLTKFLGYVRMGTRLVRAEPDAVASPSGAVQILQVSRDGSGKFCEAAAWVASDSVISGPLEYTPRAILRQAFRLLNAPYGWGGSFGEQDCSQFLCEIFATVGITLPRNSTTQMRVGVPIAGFTVATSESEKRRMLADTGLPGATVLRMPGHIMLYLGSIDGKPYAIHSTWGYKERRGLGEVVRLINRVTVSNLELGDGSARGSHLRRLTTASVITLPESTP